MKPTGTSVYPSRLLLALSLWIATIMGSVESTAGPVCDPVQTQKLLAAGGGAFDEFGQSIAASQDTIVVGSWKDDERGVDAGAAYVYVLRNGDWVFQSKLTADDAAARDRFGTAVAIDGNTIVVGAFWDDEEFIDSGAAYVFVREGDIWTQQAKLVAEDPFPNHLFGYCVALNGDTAVAGAIRDETHGFASGAAYVFVRNEGVWAQQAKLTAKDGEHNDRFGIGVGIWGDWALIGAFWDDDAGINAGTVYAYHRADGQWTQRHTINAEDADPDDRFGVSVSMSRDRAVVGAFFDNERGLNAGAAYILALDGDHWIQEAKLIAEDGAANDQFGAKVALDGNLAVVGSARHDGSSDDTGAAYVFTRTAAGWVQQARLTPKDEAERDRFGHSVGVSGDIAAVGAHLADDLGEKSGAAYAFDLNCPQPCRRDPPWICDGDVDGDGQVNPVDAGLIQSAFGSTDGVDLCQFDLDCDGQVNPVDSGIVQSLFGTCNDPRDVCP